MTGPVSGTNPPEPGLSRPGHHDPDSHAAPGPAGGFRPPAPNPTNGTVPIPQEHSGPVPDGGGAANADDPADRPDPTPLHADRPDPTPLHADRPDLTPLDADDALLDALGRGGPAPAGDLVAGLLAEWRADLDSDPAEAPAEPAAAGGVVLPLRPARSPGGRRPARQRGALPALDGRPRRRIARGPAVAVAAVILALTGVTAGALTGTPGSPLWPITRLLDPERATVLSARQHLDHAHRAILAARYDEAGRDLNAAAELIRKVRDRDTAARLRAELDRLRAELAARQGSAAPGAGTTPGTGSAPGRSPAPGGTTGGSGRPAPSPGPTGGGTGGNPLPLPTGILPTAPAPTGPVPLPSSPLPPLPISPSLPINPTLPISPSLPIKPPSLAISPSLPVKPPSLAVSPSLPVKPPSLAVGPLPGSGAGGAVPTASP